MRLMTDYSASGGAGGSGAGGSNHFHHSTQRLYSNRNSQYDHYSGRVGPNYPYPPPHHDAQQELMLTQMRSFRLATPKSNLLHTGGEANSQKATLCDHELDHLSTGEPITLNFHPGVNEPGATTTTKEQDDIGKDAGSPSVLV